VAEATKTGFAADYALQEGETAPGQIIGANPGEVMRCFAPDNLTVLNALAKEFVLCDHWFSAMAGPTEPNRMFVHAATSGVWDDSPSIEDQALMEIGLKGGLHFDTGTIYARLGQANLPFRIYSVDHLPNVALLNDISVIRDVEFFSDFTEDVKDPSFDAAYTFIEPSYDEVAEWLHDHVDSSIKVYNNSQHPPYGVAPGEQFIKAVYDAVRNSAHWNESMLIIAWDEHGGFYDHVPPPTAVPTGSRGQKYGFMFDQYGPRVPAVVISPLCQRNLIERRPLEHSFIPATVEQVFGLKPLTARDTGITGLQTLATLVTPRTAAVTIPDPVKAPQPDGDAPGTVVASGTSNNLPGGLAGFQLPAGATQAMVAARTPAAPVASAVTASAPVVPVILPAGTGTPSMPAKQVDLSLPLSSISDPWLISALAVAVKTHIEAAPADAANIQARAVGLKTYGDLARYFQEVTPLINSARVQARQQRVAARKAKAQQEKSPSAQ
jgi:phospholipase C